MWTFQSPSSSAIRPNQYPRLELAPPKSYYVETSIPEIPGWSTVSDRFAKCGSVNTFSQNNITHNSLREGRRRTLVASCFAEFNLRSHTAVECDVGDACLPYLSTKY